MVIRTSIRSFLSTVIFPGTLKRISPLDNFSSSLEIISENEGGSVGVGVGVGVGCLTEPPPPPPPPPFLCTVTLTIPLTVPLVAFTVIVPVADAIKVVAAFPSESVVADAGLTVPTAVLLLVHAMTTPDTGSPF